MKEAMTVGDMAKLLSVEDYVLFSFITRYKIKPVGQVERKSRLIKAYDLEEVKAKMEERKKINLSRFGLPYVPYEEIESRGYLKGSEVAVLANINYYGAHLWCAKRNIVPKAQTLSAGRPVKLYKKEDIIVALKKETGC